MRYKYVVVRDGTDFGKVLLSKVSMMDSDFISRVVMQTAETVHVPAVMLKNVRIPKLEHGTDDTVNLLAGDLRPEDVACMDALINAVLMAIMQERHRLFSNGKAPLTPNALKHYFMHPLQYCEKTGKFRLSIQNAARLRRKKEGDGQIVHIPGRTHDAVLLLYGVVFKSERIGIVWKIASVCPCEDENGAKFVLNEYADDEKCDSLPDTTDVELCSARIRSKVCVLRAELTDIVDTIHEQFKEDETVHVDTDELLSTQTARLCELCELCVRLENRVRSLGNIIV